MARRTLNWRELRKQVDQSELTGVAPDSAGAPGAAPPKKSRAKAAATPRVRKPRAPKVPPRLFARWGVFDGAMKRVAVFDYNQRAAAEEKLADLRARNKGPHFMQIVKEPMPEPAAAPPG